MSCDKDAAADRNEGGDAANNGGGCRLNDADGMKGARRRRHACEARERERARAQSSLPPRGDTNINVRSNNGREGKYQHQFNPMLSRN